MNSKNGMRPVHPGEVLREELEALGVSANALSKGAGCTDEARHNDLRRPTRGNS